MKTMRFAKSLYLLGKGLRHNVAGCVALAVILAGAFTAVQNVGILQALELDVFDRLLLIRPAMPIDNRIVIIGETEGDIRRYGYPIPDRALDSALNIAEQAGARVVGVDKYRDIAAPPGSEALDAMMRQHENIVWIFFSGNRNGQYISPPPALADKPEQTGFSDVLEDQDGVLRRGLLFLEIDGKTYYSFPLMITLHYLAKENIYAANDADGNFSLNGVSLTGIGPHFGAYRKIDDGGYQIMMDFPGLPHKFDFYTLSALLDGQVPPEKLHDRIVLFGATAPSLQDYRVLPNEIRRYGVEYHGYLISQLLDTALRHKKPIRSWPDSIGILWLFFWCLVGALTGLRKGGVGWLAGLIGGECLALFCSYIAMLNLGWWQPFIAPLAGWASALSISVLYFTSQERAERRQLMQLFASHVSTEVASRLWDAREQFFSEGGVRPDTLTATVLFTDLCNFTNVAESMEPLTLMKWLNQYMDEMSACIIDQGGIINKYIGDAIMAVFGVPIKSETEAAIASDAQRAVQCALKFGERLRALNRQWQAQGLPAMTMRTGIHTGPLVAGSFGGSLRKEYTVIGDTVNTASRLESFDKAFAVPDFEQPCRILIGETTQQYVRHLYRTEMVGECQLKGKNKYLKIYRVTMPVRE